MDCSPHTRIGKGVAPTGHAAKQASASEGINMNKVKGITCERGEQPRKSLFANIETASERSKRGRALVDQTGDSHKADRND